MFGHKRHLLDQHPTTRPTKRNQAVDPVQTLYHLVLSVQGLYVSVHDLHNPVVILSFNLFLRTFSKPVLHRHTSKQYTKYAGPDQFGYYTVSRMFCICHHLCPFTLFSNEQKCSLFLLLFFSGEKYCYV